MSSAGLEINFSVNTVAVFQLVREMIDGQTTGFKIRNDGTCSFSFKFDINLSSDC